MHDPWVAIVPPIVTIALAIWSRQIIPSLLIGLLAGSYLLQPTALGGVETAIDRITATITDPENLQVLLFLYLFSGLVAIIRKSGGIKAFSDAADKRIRSERGVLLTVWSLIPVTFIDCGFRIVAAGSITRSLADQHKVARSRLAFTLNNTASPVVELIPVATTFVGFNVANIAQGLKAAGAAADASAYTIWLRAIPYEFFSIVVLVVTFLSIFGRTGKHGKAPDKPRAAAGDEDMEMGMKMQEDEPAITPRMINLVVPMLCVIGLSVFFFWYFGKDKPGASSLMSAMADSEPNRAMLIALFISLALTSIIYRFQRYDVKTMTRDVISGGNEIIPTLAILAIAWPLASVSQELGLKDFIQGQLGTSVPSGYVPALLFVMASAVTYFIGSGWGAASLIMPFAIPLAVSAGAAIPVCVAAVITGGTFGDVTSPVAGMTNMASNVARADHAAYLKYASPYNFLAAGIAAILFLVAGFV